jgi:hypothetical protein
MPDTKKMGAGLLANAVNQSTNYRLTHRTRGQARSHTNPDVGLGSTPTRAALLIIGTNRYRLQRRLDQAQRNAKVMEPGLNFLFHDLPPLRVMRVGGCSVHVLCRPFLH